MNIERTEILTTLKNPHWKADMCFQIMEAQAQAMRLERHNRTLREIREYKRYCRKHGKKEIANLMANCERLYRTGYDL
jgi:hypothetical protein